MPTMRRGLTVIGAAFSLLVSTSCTHDAEVTRPKNVPVDAAYVAGTKVGGWWQRCAVRDNAAYCQIWNRGGLLLFDEEFLPYDRKSPPTAAELQIPSDPWLPGPDRLVLSNKRILFPKSRFDELKRWLDELCRPPTCIAK